MANAYAKHRISDRSLSYSSLTGANSDRRILPQSVSACFWACIPACLWRLLANDCPLVPSRRRSGVIGEWPRLHIVSASSVLQPAQIYPGNAVKFTYRCVDATRMENIQ